MFLPNFPCSAARPIVLAAVGLLVVAHSVLAQGGLPSQPFQRDPFQKKRFPNDISPLDPVQPNLNQPKRDRSLGVIGTFTPQGVVVTQVTPGSAAARAGLLPGDIVLKMDNVIVQNQIQFNQVLQTCGGTMQMIVQRGVGGQMFRALVDVNNTGCGRVRAPYALGVLGTVTAVGSIVRKVYDDTPAARAGLKPGDVIVRINNRPVTSELEYFNALNESSGTAFIDVSRGGRLSRIKTRLDLYRLGTFGTFSLLGFRAELVAPETPAAAVGLRATDEIMSIDGKPARNQPDFEKAIDLSGGTVLLQARRAFSQPGPVQVDVINNSLGCWCEPVRGGMRILSAHKLGMASKLGLQRGDVIVQIDTQRTQTLEQLQTAIENARGLMVITYRSGFDGIPGRLFVDLGR